MKSKIACLVFAMMSVTSGFILQGCSEEVNQTAGTGSAGKGTSVQSEEWKPLYTYCNPDIPGCGDAEGCNPSPQCLSTVWCQVGVNCN